MTTDGLIGIAITAGLLLAAAGVIALGRWDRVSPRWLAAAVIVLVVNDAALTRVYHLVPALLPRADWNWQGKVVALALTLAIAALPAIGWRPAGLTWRQHPGSWRAAIPVSIAYLAVFVALALAFPGDRPTGEEVAFQLTMPGLEEEAFFRGLLLLLLDRAFTARVRWLGVDWGWGAILSSALFGLAHALGVSGGQPSFDPLVMALTGGPALIAVWLRLRTGSIVLPVVLHNAGNSIGLLI